MYCLECKRCDHRALLDDDAVKAAEKAPSQPAGADESSNMSTHSGPRCPVCGSRHVKLTQFQSRFEALGYMLHRKK